MTPLERAARDRTSAFLEAMHPSADTIVTLKRGDALIPLKGSDLLLLLAALDRHETIADAGHQAAQHVRAEFEAGRHDGGQCEDCSCCTAEGCRNGADGPIGERCPSNGLGESVCPCTEG